MLLKQFKNYIESIGEYGNIEVTHNTLLIVSQECKNQKEFEEFIEWVQNEIIFNKNGKYDHLSNKEIDISNDNYGIATLQTR